MLFIIDHKYFLIKIKNYVIYFNIKKKNWKRSQIGQEDPLNLSISLSGGKETN
jgi:hypothetical protein